MEGKIEVESLLKVLDGEVNGPLPFMEVGFILYIVLGVCFGVLVGVVFTEGVIDIE